MHAHNRSRAAASRTSHAPKRALAVPYRTLAVPLAARAAAHRHAARRDHAARYSCKFVAEHGRGKKITTHSPCNTLSARTRTTGRSTQSWAARAALRAPQSSA